MMSLCLLATLIQIGDLDAVPYRSLGSTELRAPANWKDRVFSRSGRMAIRADQIYLFDISARKLVRTIGRDRVVGDGWFMSALDDAGRHLAMTHIVEKDGKAYQTTEVWDTGAVTRQTYEGRFVGWGPEDVVLTAHRQKPTDVWVLPFGVLGSAPTALVVRCYRGGRELAKAGIITRYLGLSSDRTELFCVLDGPRLQVRDSRTLKATATFAIAGESDQMRLFIGEAAGSADLVVSLGSDLRRYGRDGTEVWHVEGMSSIRTHPTKPLGVAYELSRDRLVVIDLNRGEVKRVLRYGNSTHPVLRSDGVLSIWKSAWHGPRFIDIETGLELGDDLPMAPTTWLRFRPNSHELLAVSSETVVWDTATKNVRYRLPGNEKSIGYSTDGARLHCFGKKSLAWFDADTGHQIKEVDLAQHEKRRAEPLYHRGLGDLQPRTGRLAFINRRASVRVLSADGSRVLFERLSDAERAPYFSGFSAVAFRPGTEEVVFLDRLGSTVHFHDLSTGGDREFKIRCSTATIPRRSMLFRNRRQLLLRLANPDRPARVRLGLFDTDTEEQRYVIEEELAQYNDFVFSPDKKYLICVGQQNRNNEAFWLTRYSFDYGLLRIYDADTGRAVATWKSDVGLTAVAISDDSQAIALGMSDTTVRVMKLRDLLPVPSD